MDTYCIHNDLQCTSLSTTGVTTYYVTLLQHHHTRIRHFTAPRTTTPRRTAITHCHDRFIRITTRWDSSRENDNSHLYIKCYINASRLNRYIFRTVNAINILFSTLHTTPFLYGIILFGILHLLLASIATFDTPPGSNPP